MYVCTGKWSDFRLLNEQPKITLTFPLSEIVDRLITAEPIVMTGVFHPAIVLGNGNQAVGQRLTDQIQCHAAGRAMARRVVLFRPPSRGPVAALPDKLPLGTCLKH